MHWEVLCDREMSAIKIEKLEVLKYSREKITKEMKSTLTREECAVMQRAILQVREGRSERDIR